jgi:NAD(P)-dependent dehydrogenase (short-subunit alcohol dehydrogenase family)
MPHQPDDHRRGRLAGKVALITGGESGIGLATARLFVAEGAQVLLAGLDAEALTRAHDEFGNAADVAVVDVTDEAAVRECVDSAVARFGALDVVFSNAGISGPIGPLTDCSVEDFRRVLDAHVVGAFNILKHALRVVSAGGSVVINSSVVSLTPLASTEPTKHRGAAENPSRRRLTLPT